MVGITLGGQSRALGIEGIYQTVKEDLEKLMSEIYIKNNKVVKFKLANNIELIVLYEKNFVDRYYDFYKAIASSKGSSHSKEIFEDLLYRYIQVLIVCFNSVIRSNRSFKNKFLICRIKILMGDFRGGFVKESSTPIEPHFIFSIRTFLDEALSGESLDESIKREFQVVLHEFTHFADIAYMKGYDKYLEFYLKSKDKTNAGNNFLVFDFFYKIRTESIARLLDFFYKDGYFGLRIYSESSIKEIVNYLSTSTKLEDYYDPPYNQLVPYIIGHFMIQIICFYFIIKQGLRDKLKVAVRKNGKSYSFKHFNRLYNKLNVVYVTCEYNNMKEILDEVKATVIKIDHIEFLKLYEISCKKLKIKPIYRAKDYKNTQKRIWQKFNLMTTEFEQST